MSDTSASELNREAPEAKVAKRGFAWIWLVPIVALGVVIFLAWNYFQKQGEEITIAFKRADGLEAGRTPVKYKNVTVGTVKTVSLSKDMQQVLVTVDMERSMDDWLGKGTQFWVVRPRITSGNISGLDTLVSGAYVTMEPQKGEEQDNFSGLENPPVTLSDVPGKHFTLHATRLGALDEGSSIYYHGVEVGAVQGYRMNDKGDDIEVYVFIRDPYAELIKTTTRFWNASSFALNSTVNGFEVQTESFRALLSGGVSFETPPNIPSTAAPQNSEFQLYDSQRRSDADPAGPHFYYLIEFPGDVHGLNVHAPVELNGIPIGRVVDVSQQIDLSNGSLRTPVTIEIEQDRMVIIPPNAKQKMTPQVAMNAALDQLIHKGLRAQMGSASLLTGFKYVQLNIVADQPPTTGLGTASGGIRQIPASDAGSLEDVERSAGKLVKHVDVVVGHADQFIGNLTALTGSGHNDLQDTVKSLNGTVKDLDRVLNNLDADVRPLGTQLPGLLGELKNTARSANSLLDYVDQHPDALVFGRRGDSNQSNDQGSSDQ